MHICTREHTHLLAAGEEDNDLLLQVALQEGEEQVDFVVKFTHQVALLQGGRGAGSQEKNCHVIRATCPPGSKTVTVYSRSVRIGCDIQTAAYILKYILLLNT